MHNNIFYVRDILEVSNYIETAFVLTNHLGSDSMDGKALSVSLTFK